MTNKFWNTTAQKALMGKTVTKVSYMSVKEAKELGWYKRPVVIQFNDGLEIFSSMDDEGNDGGALFTNSAETDVLPVLHIDD